MYTRPEFSAGAAMPFCITVTGLPAKIEPNHGNRNWKLEIGNRKFGTGNWKLEIRNWKFEDRESI